MYRTTGTGASQVREFPLNFHRPNYLFAYGGELFFGAAGEFGFEPYTTDGESVSLLADIRPGEVGSGPAYRTIFNDELYFSADDGVIGRRLFKTDGESVYQLGPNIRVDTASQPDEFHEFQGELYFAGDEIVDNQVTQGLFKTDGTVVTKLADIAPGPGIAQFFEFAGQLFFSASGDQGVELYRTDGTNVYLVEDINPEGNSNPGSFTLFGDDVFFNATGPNGSESYKLSALGDAPSLAGDYNGDSVVDLKDYQMWRSAIASTSDLAADGNRNGIVDTADYIVWRANLGKTLSSSSFGGSAIPEPPAVGLFVFAMLFLAVFRWSHANAHPIAFSASR
jgi:ELWxxDGT repeat protein